MLSIMLVVWSILGYSTSALTCCHLFLQVEKSPKPQASCAMPAGPGMKIKTDSPVVKKAREGVMEFLLVRATDTEDFKKVRDEGSPFHVSAKGTFSQYNSIFSDLYGLSSALWELKYVKEAFPILLLRLLSNIGLHGRDG